ncbi:MAG: SGNH/GDSL hydrolase family protein [Candidatus Acidiferrales bacterium]|jgi:lysophospholipase L1-like esterase
MMNANTAQVSITTRPSKSHTWLPNVALVLFGLIAALAVGECVARFGHRQLTSFDDHTFRKSAWSFRPGSHQESYVGAPVVINNLGLRGRDTSIAKPPGVFRIIGVGDSITFGYGVRAEDTFLQVLERDLNASAPAGMRYEVINAGVPATGLEYYTHFIEHQAPALQPDLILVCMALNDIDPLLDPEPVEGQAQKSAFRSANGYLLQHSYLYNAMYVPTKSLLYRFNVLHLKDNEGFGFLAIEPPSPEQEKARQRVNQYLRRIEAFTRAHGQRLGIVVFPVEPQLSQQSLQMYERLLHLYLGPEALNGQPQRWIGQMGADIRVPVLDLLPAMRKADRGQLFLRNQSISIDPVHPSPVGHQVAGDEIARFLRSPRVALVPSTREGAAGEQAKNRL